MLRSAAPFRTRGGTLRPLWLLLVAVAALRAFALGAYPLLDPSEGRYAEIAREMAASGDWVTPRLEPEEPFWGKPPLAFWLTAASYRLLGVNEIGARLPSYLLAAAAVACTARLGASLGGPVLGVGAALILATMGLFHVLAGTVLTDPALAAALALAMTGFALALRAEQTGSGRGWGYAFFAGVGLSVLAKGLVGPALVALALAPALTHGAFRTRARDRLPWLGGSLLLLGIALPWHVLAEIRTPGFLRYYLVGEHLDRFLVRGWQGDLYGNAHQHPPGTIWLYALAAALPWLPIAAWVALAARRRGARLLGGLDPVWTRYLAGWALAPVVLFTPARNVLITYLLPGLPALAILTAAVLQAEPGTRALLRPRLALGTPAFRTAALAVPLIFFAAAFGVLPRVAVSRSQRDLVRHFLRADGTGHASLVYLDAMPPSGDFYARGRAREISDADPRALEAVLHDGSPEFLAVKRRQLPRLPADLLTETDWLGDFGRYELLRTRASPTPAAAARPLGFVEG